jgi:peptide deformylase
MALRKIVYTGDDILRKHSKEVKEVTPRIKQLIGDMWETMLEYNGVGLAAPQVGILKQIVVIDVSASDEEESDQQEEKLEKPDPNEHNSPRNTAGAGKDRYELINPKIIKAEGEFIEDEGCLSVPGITGKVKRPVKVEVHALDGSGNEVIVTGEGLLAKALCHEIDHLNGILFTDLMIEPEDEEENESE